MSIRSIVSLALPVFAFISACSDNNLHQIDDDFGGSGPHIELIPDIIEFGMVDEGVTDVQNFEIHSTGTQQLAIEDVYIGVSNGSFTLLTDVSGVILAPGESMPVEVAFTPFGASQTANVVVTSNDEQLPMALVSLSGEGLVPELLLDPSTYDFGRTYLGCPNEGDVEILSVGTDTVQISEVKATGDGFNLTFEHALPLDLAPGESVWAHVSFDPSAEGSATGDIRVTSDEPMGVRVGDMSGEGRISGTNSDHWELPNNPKSDIVFLVDLSCSMTTDAWRLASNFDYFINTLSSYTNDWQLIVANEDDGCNTTGVLTPNTPNYADTFTTQVQRWDLFNNDFEEALLTPASRAVDKTDNGECNTGFLRPNALLHVIMVSDEEEQSSGAWQDYADQIIAKKGDATYVRLSAVAGDPSGNNNSCGADAGQRYYDAAAYTGGAFLNICDNDWSNYMGTLASTSINMDTFVLSQGAVEETIEVFINGNLRQGQWIFDSTQNAVVLTADRPTGGDEIDISYGVMANCD